MTYPLQNTTGKRMNTNFLNMAYKRPSNFISLALINSYSINAIIYNGTLKGDKEQFYCEDYLVIQNNRIVKCSSEIKVVIRRTEKNV